MEKVGSVLILFGAVLIVIIFGWVLFAGGWENTPEIIQGWGRFVRGFSEIPVIGNLVWILWVVVFIGPGFLVKALGENKKN
jgi:hypothetical protein